MAAAFEHMTRTRKQIWGTIAGSAAVLVVALVIFLLVHDDSEDDATEAVKSTLAWMHAGSSCDNWVKYSDSAAAMTLCLEKTKYTLRDVDVVADDHTSRNGQTCAVAKVRVTTKGDKATWAFTRAADSQRWVYSGTWDGLGKIVCSTTV